MQTPYRIIASISGGKDSGAMGLWLMEQGISFEPVFCDTGWEHPETYRYVREVLPRVFGPIAELRSTPPALAPDVEALALAFEARLGFPSPFVRWVLAKGMFPSRVVRFCTEELKVFPMRAHFRRLISAGETRRIVNTVGIRAQESRSRGKMPERERWAADARGDLNVEIWRPLIRWTFEDVVSIHQRHGLKPNPLYFDQDTERVGCYPCIHARKAEIKTISAFERGRIDIIRDLESVCTEMARARSALRALKPWPVGLDEDDEQRERELRDPDHPRQRRTFFHPEADDRAGIDEVVQWAQTDRGGRQFMLDLPDGAADGCMRWGMCETGGGDRGDVA